MEDTGFNKARGYYSVPDESVKSMSKLHDLTMMNLDQRRVELAKLLATGLVRLLLQRQNRTSVEVENTDETFRNGLEES
jgi:hypothetical protein